MTEEDLINVENGFLEAQRKYLEQRGWKCSTDTLTCLWLWRKTIKGTHYSANDMRAARSIQQHLENLGHE